MGQKNTKEVRQGAVSLKSANSSQYGPHDHEAVIDAQGNGYTTADNTGHSHRITKFEVQSSGTDHTHDLKESEISSSSQGYKKSMNLWRFLWILIGAALLIWLLSAIIGAIKKKKGCEPAKKEKKKEKKKDKKKPKEDDCVEQEILVVEEVDCDSIYDRQ